ncbi:MAG TPA: hypothetical protein VE981_01190 [Planctomycetota bacterium]|nr:hypothetical protein [Planctomycetota bacterium]
MGREIFYCHSCGSRVTAGDLDKGKAVRAGLIILCGSCMKKTAAPQRAKVDRVTPGA